MQFLGEFLVVCTVVLLVVHVNEQLKDSASDNVFTTQFFDKCTLEKKCRLLQPLIIFGIIDLNSLKAFARSNIISSSSVLEIAHDVEGASSVTEFLPAKDALQKESEGHVIRGDKTFIDAVGGAAIRSEISEKMKPYLSIAEDIKYLTGALGSSTAPNRSLNDRTYIIPLSGEVNVTLWSKREAAEIAAKPTTVPFIDETCSIEKSRGQSFFVKPGDAVFVPRSWWHSVEFGEHAGVLAIHYQTAPNAIATMPRLINRLIQDTKSVTRYTNLD